MTNHGITARSGRGIKFTELTEKIRPTYNFFLLFRTPFRCLYVEQELQQGYI
ncbi:hypothetical protein EV401DRAFT_1914474, partial [Pisolithus croceorrhizus]